MKGRDKDAILADLGFIELGEADDWHNERHTCGQLPSGWVIFYSNDMTFASEALTAKLSVGGEAVGCVMSETVMFSQAAGCRDGVVEWSLTRESGKKIVIEGEPPASFAALRAEAIAEQKKNEDVDYLFEVPIEVVAGMCGFRPDRDPTPDFRVLEEVGLGPRSEPSKPGWLSRMFSKR